MAGTFYPNNYKYLRSMVLRCLRDARGAAMGHPEALIAPHAGYVYSGPIAGSAYAAVAASRGSFSRVVILGPAHRVAFDGLALPSVDGLRTPLGVVRVDGAARDRLAALPFVQVDDRPHAREHALEVQLPFIQEVLGEVPVLPIVVGRASATEVARALDAVWEPRTLVVVSSDLSHYLSQAEARRVDDATCEAIEALAPERIGVEDACGRVPIAALLTLAKARGLVAHRLDVRTSGDTAGGDDAVVGYAAFAFVRPPSHEVPPSREQVENDELLLELARLSVAHAVAHGRALRLSLGRLPPALRALGASFVTLRHHADGELRGCLGTLDPTRPIALDVVENAAAAAIHDPRFSPVTSREVPDLDVSLSVIGRREALDVGGEAELLARLRPGVDGLVIEDGSRRAVFLPVVWRQLPDPHSFLDALRHKAGMPRGHWSDATRAWRFSVRELSKS